jgi:hypothetical protein
MTERNTLWAFLFGNFLMGTGVITVASARERSDQASASDRYHAVVCCHD